VSDKREQKQTKLLDQLTKELEDDAARKKFIQAVALFFRLKENTAAEYQSIMKRSNQAFLRSLKKEIPVNRQDRRQQSIPQVEPLSDQQTDQSGSQPLE